MSQEFDFIARLRAMARHPAARGLADDAAVWRDLVMTHDMIVEGVHYLSDDSPRDVAWKLLAVNLSDLAAKGATPVGVLMGYSLGDGAWDAAFAEGLDAALQAFDVALLGGDTVRMPRGAPRALGLTAIGTAPEAGAPDRRNMAVGDDIWVSGTIGDAGAGLKLRLGELVGDDADLLAAYVRPVPRLALGQGLATHVSAMMDVSDGLLIDVSRMAAASGCVAALELDALPLSAAYRALCGDSAEARMAAARAGDDYELLFAASPQAGEAIQAAARACGVAVTRIGRAQSAVTIAGVNSAALRLTHEDQAVELPASLGYSH